MGANKPTYEELETRLAEAERTLEAVRSDKIDAVVGKKGVYLLRLTELKSALKAEQLRMETLLQQIPEGVVVAEAPSGRLIAGNARVAEIWRHDFIQCETMKDYENYRGFNPDGSKLLPAEWPLARTIRTGETVLQQEIKFQRGDGTFGWMLVNSAPVQNRDGEMIAALAIFQDITERKHLEETLQQANQEMTEYAYALTHNLKAPLRAVHNYVNFLSEDLGDSLQGDQLKHLAGIKNAIKESSKQFEDLELLYSVRNHPIQFEYLALDEIIREIEPIFKSASKERQLIVAEEWPIFRSERFLLRQILMNLISNGFKYNTSSKKRVEIGWRLDGNNAVEIFVRDNGIGIEPEYYGHIFEIFKRLHGNREYEGSGVGLSIVKKASRMIGGTLRIESEPGKGSTFFVRLPDNIVVD